MCDQEQQHITQFELYALAFADMIDNITRGPNPADAKAPVRLPRQELPPFSTIRCICGNNENRGKLVCCHECHCYLHEDCVDQQQLKRGPHFRCPFCRLQLDGVDPFRELTNWISQIDDELKSIYVQIGEAEQLESQITSPHLDQHGMMWHRQRPPMQHPTHTLQKKLTEIRRSIISLMNL